MATVKLYPDNEKTASYGIWQLNECYKCDKLNYHNEVIESLPLKTHTVNFNKFVYITAADITRVFDIAEPVIKNYGTIPENDGIRLWYNSGFPVVGFAHYAWGIGINPTKYFAVTTLLNGSDFTFDNESDETIISGNDISNASYDNFTTTNLDIPRSAPNMNSGETLNAGFEFIRLKRPCTVMTLEEWRDECLNWITIYDNMVISNERRENPVFVDSNFEDGNFFYKMYNLYNQLVPGKFGKFSDHQLI